MPSFLANLNEKGARLRFKVGRGLQSSHHTRSTVWGDGPNAFFLFGEYGFDYHESSPYQANFARSQAARGNHEIPRVKRKLRGGFSLARVVGRVRLEGEPPYRIPSWVNVLALTNVQIWRESSGSSSLPISCVQNGTHRAFHRTHWVCPKPQGPCHIKILRSY